MWRIWQAAVVATTAFWSVMPSQAAEPSSIGEAGGAWSVRTQLVWDESAGELKRRRLRVWRDATADDLEFYWEPQSGAPASGAEAVTGRGTLTWRRAGTPSYNRSAVVSSYTGEMRDGRANGIGRLETSNGETFAGEWRDGRLEGQGTVRHENGDQYEGDFVGGQPHGTGRYVSANGEIFEGGFAGGRRQGTGVLTAPGGAPRVAHYVQDAEVMSAADPSPVQFAPANDVTVSIIADTKKFKQLASDRGGSYLGYTHTAGSAEIAIYPASPLLMSVWKRNGPLLEWTSRGPSELRDTEDVQFKAPAILRLSVASKTPSIELQKLYLQVQQTLLDPEPMLHVEGAVCYNGCACDTDTSRGTQIRLHNSGWGAVRAPRLKFSFTSAGAKPGSGPQGFDERRAARSGSAARMPQSYEVALSPFDTTASVDIAKQVAAAAGTSGPLAHLYKCANYNDLARCQTEYVSRGPFGALKPYIGFGGESTDYAVLGVQGELTFEFTDVDGVARRGTKQVRTEINLGRIDVEPPLECGAGGPDELEAGMPVLELPFGRKGYVLTYPLKKAVPLVAGIKDFNLGLYSSKSSLSTFSVIAELTGGRKVASPPVRLNYFRPRPDPDFLRNNQQHTPPR